MPISGGFDQMGSGGASTVPANIAQQDSYQALANRARGILIRAHDRMTDWEGGPVPEDEDKLPERSLGQCMAEILDLADRLATRIDALKARVGPL